MRKIVLFFFTAVLFVAMFPGSSISANGYKEIDALGVKELMDKEDALVVFPLSPMEFDNKHIKGSVNIIPKKMEYELPADNSRREPFITLLAVPRAASPD